MKVANTLKQVVKYGFVGMLNTLITFIVYVVLTKALACPTGLSNFAGYAAGLINSYLWNRQWTFHYNGSWLGSALRFFGTFGICYLLQLGFVVYLNHTLNWGFRLGNIAVSADQCNFVIGMILYNILFFTLSKFFTFKEQKA
ncbi:MAG: GtrA family protein [Tannerella sp.]|jgi:putative flippase GtrA|nr:GtrA family protein [Tannerella sp.]